MISQFFSLGVWCNKDKVKEKNLGKAESSTSVEPYSSEKLV